MKHFFLVVFFWNCMTPVIAQSGNRTLLAKTKKPSLDTSILGKWPSLSTSNVTISNDGNYVSYFIEKQPVNGSTLTIQSTSNSWKREFVNALPGVFAADSKQFIFMKNDTLFFLQL